MSATPKPRVAQQGVLDAESRQRGLLFLPFPPVVLALIASVAPTWSSLWAIVNGALILVAVVWMLMLVYGGRSASPRSRVGLSVYVLDLFGLFALVLVWRGSHAPLWLDTLLGAVTVGAGLGAIGVEAASAIAFSTSQALPPVALLGALYVLALLLVVVGHSLWTRAENPSWEPGGARGSRREVPASD